MVRLTLLEPTPIPVEVETLLPERLNGLSLERIGALLVNHGNRDVRVDSLFEIIQHDQSADVVFAGPTQCLKRIGEGMSAGTIVVEGDAGMHAGAKMLGGSLLIHGRAGDWLGAEMRGGTIEVSGDAGSCAGAGYRGCRRGMTGGTIRIHGDAGDELGAHLRRGTICVDGNAGRFAGVDLIAGTILIGGDAGPGTGVGMKRGTIIIGGRAETHPGLAYAGEFEPAYLGLLMKTWNRAMPTRCFRGDRNMNGLGEVWMTH